MTQESNSEVPLQAGKIDKGIHEPARLMIMACLFIVENADFLFLTRQTGLTDGNLSSHMARLEAAGYLDIQKDFVGKKPRTILSLTDIGRSEFKTYRTGMSQLLGTLPDE